MITYRDITINDISLIEGLWYMNKDYHSKISPYFKDNYNQLDFEGRFSKLEDNDDYRITIALDNKNTVGFIISTINNKIGEHLSFHVRSDYRGEGIGKVLLNNHIEWLMINECESIKIKVSYENLNTIGFYRSQGFQTDTVDMILNT